MSASAFPLTWPLQFPRTKYREHGRFKTALPNAIKNVQSSLRGFASDSGKKLENLVISSNVTLGADAPADPGVAVWFVWDGLHVCIPVDRYVTVASNLQAIHYIVEARRVELRHGTLALMRATFTGFIALPAPAGQQPKRTWREVFGYGPHNTVNRSMLDERMRILRSERHPDRGGSTDAFTELTDAYALACQEVR